MRSPEYWAWIDMRRRCLDANREAYKNYGGRGITVCAEWQTSFEAFLAHVGLRPSPAHSLDRIDNSEGYRPGNVRWATTTEQGRNKRNVRNITFLGETLPLSVWAIRLKISAKALRYRLDLQGWDIERALTTPPRAHELITFRGESMTLFAWSKRLGIHQNTLFGRIRSGWTIERALTTPPIRYARRDHCLAP